MSAITRRLDRLEQDVACPSRLHVIELPHDADREQARRDREQQLGHAIPERNLIVYVKRYTEPLGSP